MPASAALTVPDLTVQGGRGLGAGRCAESLKGDLTANNIFSPPNQPRPFR